MKTAQQTTNKDMAVKRIYTITPAKISGYKDGFKVNYTVEGFAPGSTETKHKEFTSETAALRFVEQLKKGGWKAD